MSTPGDLGNKSTALGNLALRKQITDNEIGFDVTAYGNEALKNLDGHKKESCAFGSCALKDNLTGENVAIGTHAGDKATGTNNTIGGNWGMRNNSGNENVAFGHRSLAGDDGSEAVIPVQTVNGSYNTAVGSRSMRKNPEGNNNSALGYNSMANIESDDADNNTAVGSETLVGVKKHDNTAVGRSAGKNVVDGFKNTFLGKSAGETIESGNNNTLLGADTDVDSDSAKFRTAVGSGAVVNKDNCIVLGRSSGPVLDKVGIRTPSPSAVLHLVSDNFEDALYSEVYNEGHALHSSASGTTNTSGVALKTDGGHVYKVVNIIDSSNAGPYIATVNDHTIILSEVAGAFDVVLPSPGNIGDGHVFTIRNASASAVTVSCDGTSRFVDHGVAYSAPTLTALLPTGGLPNSLSKTFMSSSGKYYRIS